MKERKDKIYFAGQRSGAALMLTIIVLVILTAVVYRVSSAISQWKHRLQYTIDYQNARYAAESGIKYGLTVIGEIEPNYVSRPNEPDFSDLFTMSDEEYKLMMEEWARELERQLDANSLNKNDSSVSKVDLSLLFGKDDANNPDSLFNDLKSLFGAGDINDMNELESFFAGSSPDTNISPEQLFVRGPYGPPWPYITEPVEIEFGDAKVTIEMIDENAKLPLVWGISSDEQVKNETKAAVVTFCEWMQMEPNDIDPFMKELADIKEVKPFSVNLKPVITVTTQQAAATADNASMSRSQRLRARRISRRGASRQRAATVQQIRPQAGHTMDFAKLMHSPMLDLELLAKPVNQDLNRQESSLKYMSLWGATQVNINSAERNVLEAAFTFGGDAVEIADAIIKERKIEPFRDIDDLSKRLFRYTDSIDKCRPYITTQSDFFSIRVKATSGVARVCATAGLKKEQGKYQRIGIIIE
jgi:DNA uptake protein ComE-like DNA-binding protein